MWVSQLLVVLAVLGGSCTWVVVVWGLTVKHTIILHLTVRALCAAVLNAYEYFQSQGAVPSHQQREDIIVGTKLEQTSHAQALAGLF